MRARRGFGMILDAEGGYPTVLKSFNGVVVQVDVRDVNVVEIQTFRIYRKTVVLSGDLHLLPLKVQNWMIAAMMSEFQLVRTASQRKTENLVAKANPEHRFFAEEIPNILDRIFERFRIAWAVG